MLAVKAARSEHWIWETVFITEHSLPKLSCEKHIFSFSNKVKVDTPVYCVYLMCVHCIPRWDLTWLHLTPPIISQYLAYRYCADGHTKLQPIKCYITREKIWKRVVTYIRPRKIKGREQGPFENFCQCERLANYTVIIIQSKMTPVNIFCCRFLH